MNIFAFYNVIYICVLLIRVHLWKFVFAPQAIAQSFKSLHSLLTLNTEYGGKEKKCKQLFQYSKQSLRVSVPPENHTTCAPCFTEGYSESDNQSSLTSLLRTFSHHVHHACISVSDHLQSVYVVL